MKGIGSPLKDVAESLVVLFGRLLQGPPIDLSCAQPIPLSLAFARVVYETAVCRWFLRHFSPAGADCALILLSFAVCDTSGAGFQDRYLYKRLDGVKGRVSTRVRSTGERGRFEGGRAVNRFR